MSEGYTHYWELLENIEPEVWLKICEGALSVIRSSVVTVALDHDMPDRVPYISNQAIRFNGIGDEADEPFWLCPVPGSSFCRTSKKPYDEIATAILILAEYYTEGKYHVHSDGNVDDWKRGLRLAQKVELEAGVPWGIAK